MNRPQSRSRDPRAPLISWTTPLTLEHLEARCVLNAAGMSGTVCTVPLDVLAIEFDSLGSSSVLVATEPDSSALDFGIGSATTELTDGLWQVELDAGVSVSEAIESLEATPGVLFAQPDYTVSINGEPDDPGFPLQWALENTGQNGGTVDADIDVTSAWDVTTSAEFDHRPIDYSS